MKWYKVEFELGDSSYDLFGINVGYAEKKTLLEYIKQTLSKIEYDVRIKNIKIKGKK